MPSEPTVDKKGFLSIPIGETLASTMLEGVFRKERERLEAALAKGDTEAADIAINWVAADELSNSLEAWSVQIDTMGHGRAVPRAMAHTLHRLAIFYRETLEWLWAEAEKEWDKQ